MFRYMSVEHRIGKKVVVSLGTSVKSREWPDTLLEVGIRIKRFSARTIYLVASSVTDSYYRVSSLLRLCWSSIVFSNHHQSCFWDFYHSSQFLHVPIRMNDNISFAFVNLSPRVHTF